MKPSDTQRRATYLHWMGIPMWVPRYRLPGAASSRRCAWQSAPAKQSSKARVLETLEAITAPLPAASTALEQLTTTRFTAKAVMAAPDQPSPTLKEQEPTSTPLLATPMASLQTPVSLQAEVWLLANGWQLLLEGTTERFNQQEILLCQNLLRALAPQSLGVISQQRFQWPHPRLAQADELDLITSLRVFLTGAQYQRFTLVGLLVLGERSHRYLCDQRIDWPHLPPLYAGPALSDLCQQPHAKAHFWQLAGAQGLRAHFAASPLLI